jgi:hypothetical protein
MIVRSVSYSSDRTAARCDMMYHYRYEERLKKRVKKIGLYRGDWIHQLLEHYRKTGKWKSKFKAIKAEMWDKLFDEEKEEYGLDFPMSVVELFSHYVEYWSPEDSNYEVVSVEQECELDTNHGFPIRWKMDAIMRDRQTGHLVLFENKNKKTIPESEERILQPQPHTYAYLYEKLTGNRIHKIIWDYIRTSPVPRPQVLKSGGLSVRKINTDQRGYTLSLKEAGIQANDGEEWQAIQAHIESLPETLALERVSNVVNPKIGRRFANEWIARGLRLQGIKTPLLTYTKDCKWGCDYYNLCQSEMRGGHDRDLIIKKDFLVNIKVDLEVKDYERA